MIEGIADKVSAAYSIIPTIFLFAAYSVKYIAAPIPSGSTIAKVAITIYNVFKISGKKRSQKF